MKFILRTLLTLAIGGLMGGLSVWLLNTEAEKDTSNEPLYWVAPMDPNYRKDKPGKSPMGMDLIPVYKEANAVEDVGTVTISPDVVNNLGVRTATVTKGHLDVTVNTVGYVQYDEDRLIHIHPRVEGWVEKLYVKASGDPVIEGEPLYALYSPTLVNAQEEYLLARKRNNPKLVAAALQRLTALQVPQSAIDDLMKTGKVSQTITLKAPQSGVLDNLNAREGMYVKPGMEMMTIGQLEHIWAIAEVFERQAASVQEGDPVRMQLDYLPGREWVGTVDYIYPSLNSKTRTAQVRVHFDNPDGYLRPGMFAQIEIRTKPEEDALLIPREALIRTGDQARVVLAKDAGRFKSIAVKVGKVGEQWVEILSGLKEGEEIVTSAQFLIDSESSKTSDFKRMHHEEESATVAGVINTVDIAKRVLNISRDAIPKWNRPAATLDFGVAEGVAMEPLSVGDKIRFTFTVDEGEFVVTNIATIRDQQNQEHNHD